MAIGPVNVKITGSDAGFSKAFKFAQNTVAEFGSKVPQEFDRIQLSSVKLGKALEMMKDKPLKAFLDIEQASKKTAAEVEKTSAKIASSIARGAVGGGNPGDAKKGFVSLGQFASGASNIGDIAASLSTATNSAGAFSQSLGAVADGVGTASHLVFGLSGAFKALGAALISNPILLVAAAITAAGVAIAKFVAGQNEEVDKFNEKLQALDKKRQDLLQGEKDKTASVGLSDADQKRLELKIKIRDLEKEAREAEKNAPKETVGGALMGVRVEGGNDFEKRIASYRAAQAELEKQIAKEAAITAETEKQARWDEESQRKNAEYAQGQALVNRLALDATVAGDAHAKAMRQLVGDVTLTAQQYAEVEKYQKQIEEREKRAEEREKKKKEEAQGRAEIEKGILGLQERINNFGKDSLQIELDKLKATKGASNLTDAQVDKLGRQLRILEFNKDLEEGIKKAKEDEVELTKGQKWLQDFEKSHKLNTWAKRYAAQDVATAIDTADRRQKVKGLVDDLNRNRFKYTAGEAIQGGSAASALIANQASLQLVGNQELAKEGIANKQLTAQEETAKNTKELVKRIPQSQSQVMPGNF